MFVNAPVSYYVLFIPLSCCFFAGFWGVFWFLFNVKKGANLWFKFLRTPFSRIKGLNFWRVVLKRLPGSYDRKPAWISSNKLTLGHVSKYSILESLLWFERGFSLLRNKCL